MTLEFCSRVRSAGGDAEFVQRDGDKSPDARVKILDRWVTVEFKALHDRDEMEAWYEFEETVMNRLSVRGVAYVAFDRELTDKARADPDAVVEGLASIAARNVREYEPLPHGTGRARIASINTGKCGYRRRAKGLDNGPLLRSPTGCSDQRSREMAKSVRRSGENGSKGGSAPTKVL
jgi:hypothetical protein